MAELGYNDSIGGLVRGILNDLRELVREEIALARVEVRDTAGRAKLAAASLGAAVVALAFGGTFLLIAVAVGIADLFNWPVWAGFLVVALLLSVAGAVMFAAGRKRLRTIQPVPEQTVQTLKENSEWIAKRLSSANR
jgi:membrane protein implicated in regulation of membrane protease activity